MLTLKSSTALIFALILGFVETNSMAEDANPSMNPTFQYEGKTLSLRSSAIKEVSFLKVNVYQVGLYLEAVTTASDSLLSSEQTKAFVLRFLLDVKKEKLAEAWMKDLQLYCETECDSLMSRGRPLADKLPDIKSGQEVTYVVLPERVDVLVDNILLGQLQGPEASRTIVSAFIGKKAPAGLRADLLETDKRGQ